MADHHKKKTFLNTPRYPGGNEAFRAFIAGNIRYPQEALDAGIEGAVVVEFDVLDTGVVKNQHVLKGLGHGCDEEALRVIGLLIFGKVKNRGVRLKMTTKTTINFKLPPGVRISYTTPESAVVEKPAEEGKPLTYEYTVNL
ncbi:MAG: energy transducer TonB [Bacteroidota bacterium]